MPIRRPNPLQLTVLAIAGAALVASVWFLGFLPVPRLPVQSQGFWSSLWSLRLRLAVFLTPLLGGLALMIWAEKRFKRGFLDDLWTETELQQVRGLVESSAWKPISWVLLACMVLGMALHRQGFNLAWCWYALLQPTQAVQRFRHLLAPRIPVDSGLHVLGSWKPVRSEHWGESRT